MKRAAARAPRIKPPPTQTTEPAAVWVPIDNLIPWPKNPRRNDAAVDVVAASIKRFGFGAPLIVRTANRMVIAGHTRLKAAHKLGLTEVPVRFLDIAETEAEAMAIADNKTGELATWDDTALGEILSTTPNLEGLGFSQSDLDDLLSGLSSNDPPGPAEGQLIAPFPYFGGKRDVAVEVWRRFGLVRQYVEPFCGSAAVLLAAPQPAALEVAGDANGFLANFWRAVVMQHLEVCRWVDYPVSHVDLGARHGWLMAQRERIAAEMQDPMWPGDAQVAGWWLWGQCAWIGSGWCEWGRETPMPPPPGATGVDDAGGTIPLIGNAGRGVQAGGQVPHVGNAGVGVQALGQIPQMDAGRGVLATPGEAAGTGVGPPWTSAGRTALEWLGRIAARMERVRIVHGTWDRCLNHHFGGDDTAVFFDPPYLGYEEPYRTAPVAADVAAWCRENARLRIALCGHIGDYELPGWTVYEWSRRRLTYSGGGTRHREAIWFSPACLNPGDPGDPPEDPATPLI